MMGSTSKWLLCHHLRQGGSLMSWPVLSQATQHGLHTAVSCEPAMLSLRTAALHPTAQNTTGAGALQPLCSRSLMRSQGIEGSSFAHGDHTFARQSKMSCFAARDAANAVLPSSTSSSCNSTSGLSRCSSIARKDLVSAGSISAQCLSERPTSAPTSYSTRHPASLAVLPQQWRWPSARHAPLGLLPGMSGSLALLPTPVLPFSPLQMQRRQMASWGGFPSGGGGGNWLQNVFASIGWNEWGRYVTNVLIISNVTMYIITLFNKNLLGRFAQVPYLVSHGEWYRIITAGFLHAGVLHLLSNVLALHWLGPPLERAVGAERMAVIYGVSLVGGGLLQHWMGGSAVALGASGGIAGLFGAWVAYKVINRSQVGFDGGDISWVAQIVGLNVLLGVMSGGGIGHWAHLGGLLGGIGSMYLIGPRMVWISGRGMVDQPILQLPTFKNK